MQVFHNVSSLAVVKGGFLEALKLQTPNFAGVSNPYLEMLSCHSYIVASSHHL